jgi:hypothetical protein
MMYFIVLSTLSFLNCEKYINSQTDSNLNDRVIKVSGTVINEFTNQPIKGALVNFGGQDTLTDYLGWFEMRYRLTVDNDRNKPVEMTVLAYNYFDYQQLYYIAPIDYTITARMTYAAPIIKNSVLVRHYFDEQEMDLVVVQALVFDYQGADDIDSVGTILYYRNEEDQSFRTSIIPMRFVEKLSSNSAHYQAVAIPTYQAIWSIQQNFDVYAEDSQGYSTFVQDAPINPFSGDTLIFPPIYYHPKLDSIFTN